MEDGQLAELHIDRGDERGYVGNIYLGKVVRVLPGMQAAFVDVGMERAAFLYVGDIVPEMIGRGTEDAEEEIEDVPEEGARSSPKPGMPAIQDLLSEGQELLVQVSKDPIGTKGARVTTHIAIPGRYLVCMPTVDHVGISRRIERDKDRRRLREFVDRHRRKGHGYIVRTVCEGQSTESLKADMEYLERTWDKVAEQRATRKAPSLLHEEVGLVIRLLRDIVDREIHRVILDDASTAEEVRAFLGDAGAGNRVQQYRGAEPIFDTYGVETEIHRALGRKVWLKSGGYLVIDQAEALMAIDVNSGRYVGSTSLEETTLKINLEAVQEIVYQLRLRNMGGIIILDFIDMDREANRDRVYKALEEALKKDRARTNVLKISELGMVEMTRKRTQEGLDRYLNEACSTCKGTGQLRARATLVYDVLRELRRVAHRTPDAAVLTVDVAPALADELYGERFDDLEAVERQVGRRVVVRATLGKHPEEFAVTAR